MIREGDMREVQQLIYKLGVEIKTLVKNALELAYFSRGAWPYESVLQMSAGERELATEFISEQLKHAAKKGYPIF